MATVDSNLAFVLGSWPCPPHSLRRRYQDTTRSETSQYPAKQSYALLNSLSRIQYDGDALSSRPLRFAWINTKCLSETDPLKTHSRTLLILCILRILCKVSGTIRRFSDCLLILYPQILHNRVVLHAQSPWRDTLIVFCVTSIPKRDIHNPILFPWIPSKVSMAFIHSSSPCHAW